MAIRKNSPARRAAGQLEHEVLAALWASRGPMTPVQVQVALGGDLAYNTIHTILVRLHEKGQVTRAGHSRAAYVPVKDAADTAADQMRAALEANTDRRVVLARFVDGLSPADEAALRAALGETD